MRRSSNKAPSSKVTIRQVAKRAGVSTATISRVLSGRRRLDHAVAQRVRAAARGLNDQPIRIARNLRTQLCL